MSLLNPKLLRYGLGLGVVIPRSLDSIKKDGAGRKMKGREFEVEDDARGCPVEARCVSYGPKRQTCTLPEVCLPIVMMIWREKEVGFISARETR